MNRQTASRCIALLGFSISAPIDAKVLRLDPCTSPLRIALHSPAPESKAYELVSCGLGVQEHATTSDEEIPSEARPAEVSALRRADRVVLRAMWPADAATVRLDETEFKLGAREQAWVPASGGAAWRVSIAPTEADLISIEVEDESLAAIARMLVATESLRLEHIERLPATPITLRFGAVSPHSVLSILADVGETLLLRGTPGHFGFLAPKQAALVRRRLDAVMAASIEPDDSALEPALRALLEAAPDEGELALDLVEQQTTLSHIVRARDDLVEAERWQRAALVAIRRFDGPELSPRAAIALSRLAGLREDQGDHAEAVRLWREAVEVGERVLARDDPSLQSAFMALARDASDGQRLVEADDYFKRAVARVKAVPTDTVEALRSTTMLAAYALWLEQQGRGGEATSLLERQLEITRAHYGEDDAMTGMALAQLAQHWVEQDELARARPLIAKVLSIGSESSARWIYHAPQVLAAIDALGPLAQRGADTSALPVLRKTLKAAPHDKDVLYEMIRLLEQRADRQATDPGQIAQRRVTCEAVGEVHVFIAHAHGASAATTQAAGEVSRNACLKSAAGD